MQRQLEGRNTGGGEWKTKRRRRIQKKDVALMFLCARDIQQRLEDIRRKSDEADEEDDDTTVLWCDAQTCRMEGVFTK